MGGVQLGVPGRFPLYLDMLLAMVSRPGDSAWSDESEENMADRDGGIESSIWLLVNPLFCGDEGAYISAFAFAFVFWM